MKSCRPRNPRIEDLVFNREVTRVAVCSRWIAGHVQCLGSYRGSHKSPAAVVAKEPKHVALLPYFKPLPCLNWLDLLAQPSSGLLTHSSGLKTEMEIAHIEFRRQITCIIYQTYSIWDFITRAAIAIQRDVVNSIKINWGIQKIENSGADLLTQNLLSLPLLYKLVGRQYDPVDKHTWPISIQF
jgi:hypothetical protein